MLISASLYGPSLSWDLRGGWVGKRGLGWGWGTEFSGVGGVRCDGGWWEWEGIDVVEEDRMGWSGTECGGGGHSVLKGDRDGWRG